MMKIVRATPIRDRVLRLEFSDGTSGDYDLTPLISRGTSLTSALAEEGYFGRVYLELGALAWPNGFELGPGAIHRELKESGALRPPARVA